MSSVGLRIPALCPSQAEEQLLTADREGKKNAIAIPGVSWTDAC